MKRFITSLGIRDKLLQSVGSLPGRVYVGDSRGEVPDEATRRNHGAESRGTFMRRAVMAAACIALLAGCGSSIGNSNRGYPAPSSSASPPFSPAASTSTEPTSTVQQLLRESGTGDHVFDQVIVPAAWNVSYLFDCDATIGKPGDFAISAQEGSPAIPDILFTDVQQRGFGTIKKTGFANGTSGGPVVLRVVTPCKWTLTVTAG